MNYIFVYGSLKSEFNNNYILRGSKFISICETENKYEMLSLGYFPAVTKSSSKYFISGELYAISDEILQRIDILENEGFLYKKEKIFLQDFAEAAWMYFFMDTPRLMKYNMGDEGIVAIDNTQTWVYKL